MEGGASNNNPSHANSVFNDEGNISRFFQLDASTLAADAPSRGYVALLQGEGEVNLEQQLRAQMNSDQDDIDLNIALNLEQELRAESDQGDIDLNIAPTISDEFSDLELIPGGQISYIPCSSNGPFHHEAESSNGPRCRCGKRKRLDENEAGTSSSSHQVQEFCECELELASNSHPISSLTLPQVRSSSTSTQLVLPSVHASSFSTFQPGPSQMPQLLPLPNLLHQNVASTSANQPGGYFGHNPWISFLPTQNGQSAFGSVGQQPFRAPGILIRDAAAQANGGDQTFAGASNTSVANSQSMATQQPGPRPPSAMSTVQEVLSAAASSGEVNWSLTRGQLLDLIRVSTLVPVNPIPMRSPAQVVVMEDDGEVDAHHAMRLDVDRMSYEELLELSDRIGHVNTGLAENIIDQRIQRYTLENTLEQYESCCICLEEYASVEVLGKLDCGHEFHFVCIKQWLQQKNSCPICKKPAVES